MDVNKAQGFVEIEHTADLALRIWAPTLKDLYKLAVEGMNSLIKFTLNENASGNYEQFSFDGVDLESMLVALLNECNYKLQQDYLSSKITEICVENQKLTGTFFHQKIKSFDMEIKAVTYHNLKIMHSELGYVVDIVFDV